MEEVLVVMQVMVGCTGCWLIFHESRFKVARGEVSALHFSVPFFGTTPTPSAMKKTRDVKRDRQQTLLRHLDMRLRVTSTNRRPAAADSRGPSGFAARATPRANHLNEQVAKQPQERSRWSAAGCGQVSARLGQRPVQKMTTAS